MAALTPRWSNQITAIRTSKPSGCGKERQEDTAAHGDDCRRADALVKAARRKRDSLTTPPVPRVISARTVPAHYWYIYSRRAVQRVRPPDKGGETYSSCNTVSSGFPVLFRHRIGT